MSAVWKLDFITAHMQQAEAALELFGATTWASEKIDNPLLTQDDVEGDWRFGVYFEGKPDLSGLQLPEDAVATLAPVPPRDWVSQNQQNLPPIAIAPLYLHGSHDHPRDGHWRNIEMQAGQAFGSGHHGTTQGCLYLFVELLKRYAPHTIADIGCGSGTLAIAAAKLCGSSDTILASDNDPVAVRVTQSNLALNGVAPQIRAFPALGMQHKAYQGRRFDVIFANIMAGPLVHLAADFEAQVSATGRVILSGLLNEQARRVKARYRAAGFRVESQKIIGAWTSLCLKR